MNSFKLTVSSPDGDLFRGDVTVLSLRGIEGDLAIMAGHIPFITAVKPCDCHVEFPEGPARTGHTEGGLLTVGADSVTLLSGSFKWVD